VIIINLLPWREARRTRRKKQFYLGLFIAALLGVLLCLVLRQVITLRLHEQNQRVVYLKQQRSKIAPQAAEVKSLDADKQALLLKLTLLQNLGAARNIPVQILNALPGIVPDNVTLVSLSRKGQTLFITGFADSGTATAELMKQIDASPLFNEPSLNELKSQSDATTSHSFSIEVSLTSQGGDGAQ
jgi:type IV pilus assembly protein PilN